MSAQVEYGLPPRNSQGSFGRRLEPSWYADKERLVNLFRNFRSSAVEAEHLDMARELIDRHRGQKWYESVPLDKILEENGVRERTDQLMMMASVFDYLIKYAVNLIKPQLHFKWRCISTNKEMFRTSVDCMRGARGILKQLGYTHCTETTMEFERDVREPDRNKIAHITAELLMCKLEVEKMHQNPQLLRYHLPKAGYGPKDRYHGDSDDEFFDAQDDLRDNYGQGGAPYRAGSSRSTDVYGVGSQQLPHQPPLRAGGITSSSSSYSPHAPRTAHVPRAGQREQPPERECSSVSSDLLGSKQHSYDTATPHYGAHDNHYQTGGSSFDDIKRPLGSSETASNPLGGNRSPLMGGGGMRGTLDNTNTRTSVGSNFPSVERSIASSSATMTSAGVYTQSGGFERPAVSTVQSSIPFVPSISSSGSSTERPSISPGLNNPISPPAVGGVPGAEGQIPGGRPVPVPRKRTKSKTSVLSSGGSSGRPMSTGSLSSSSESLDLSFVGGTGRLPGDMSSSFNYGTSPSTKEPDNSATISLSNSAGSSSIGLSGSSSSGIGSLQEMLAKLKQKRVDVVESHAETTALPSLGSQDLSSLSQRKSLTAGHILREKEDTLDVHSLRSGATNKPPPPASLSTGTSSSLSEIKYPPGRRAQVSFHQDSILEEDENISSFDGSGLANMVVSSGVGHGHPVPLSGQQVSPDEQHVPSVDHQGFPRNVHTPPLGHQTPPMDRRPHSGEYRPHSGEHRPPSGEHHPPSRERNPSSGEHRPPSGEHHDYSGEHHRHQPHDLPIDYSNPITPTAAPRPNARPLTTPISQQGYCRECRTPISSPGQVKFCFECGVRDPCSSSQEDLHKTVQPRPYKEEKPPMRASVKDTEQVEQKHWSKIQQLEKEDEVRSKTPSQQGSQGRDTGLNSRREEDWEGRFGALDLGLNERDEGGATSEVGWGNDNVEMGGLSLGIDKDKFGDEKISMALEQNLESARHMEEKKAKAFREFQEKKAREERERKAREERERKAREEREKEEQERPDADRQRNVGRGGAGIDGGRGFENNTGGAASERVGGAGRFGDEKISLAVEGNLESIRQQEEEEKERYRLAYLRKKEQEEREMQNQMRNREDAGADFRGRAGPSNPAEGGASSRTAGGVLADDTIRNDIQRNLDAIRQEEEEKERRRKEFEQRRKRERKQQNNIVMGELEAPPSSSRERSNNSAQPGAVAGGGKASSFSKGESSSRPGGGVVGPSGRDGSPPRAIDFSKMRGDFNLVDKLEREGKQLLACFKECMEYNYSLGEIQQAYHESHDRNALRYLDTTWANKVRTVRHNIGNHHRNGGRKLGFPTEKEAREMLVRTGGNVEQASINIAQEREKKIRELLIKMGSLKKRDPSLQELDWDGAAEALSRNEMDVSATFYVLQTEWLEPLYEFIYSEFSNVKQKDMEDIKSMITNKKDHEKYSLEARNRLLMAEFRFQEQEKAAMVLELIEKVEGEDQSYPLNYYIDAAKDFGSVEDALAFLSKECPLCFALYPIHEMITMPGCTDSFCKHCFKQNLTVVVRNQEVKHYNCPVCSIPNMADREAANDMYLQILVAMAKEYLDPDVYQMMENKLRDFNLMTHPDFYWCGSCPNGFIFEVDAPRVPRGITCPNCRKKMCHICKKPWEDQHEGNSCETFARWKQDNDPDAQKQGLAAHLNANGIECPACHMRYDLAKGGCMHFSCTRCPNEFCSGCSLSIKKGMQCGRFESCKKLGLHAHHPRDCLFYLRDFDVKELQDFLRENKVEFDVEPPKEQVDAARAKNEEEGNADAKVADVALHCRVMLQKEKPEGLRDEECGKEVTAGYAGLCATHYKEYLVDKINKNKLDPVSMYPLHQIKRILEREEMKVPEINDENVGEEEETEEQYRERLIEHVKRVLPLLRQQGEVGGGDLEALPAQNALLVVEDLEEMP